MSARAIPLKRMSRRRRAKATAEAPVSVNDRPIIRSTGWSCDERNSSAISGAAAQTTALKAAPRTTLVHMPARTWAVDRSRL